MQRILRYLPFGGVIALLAYMPFHIFLSQWLSLATGGLDAWKLGKDAALAVLAMFSICLVWQQRKGMRQFHILLVGGVLYAALHGVLWLTHPALFRDSVLLGIIYNNRLFAYVVLGMAAGLLMAVKDRTKVFSIVTRVILIVSTIVAVLGVVQYFLPKDILTHVGYSLDRGVRPNFFIDDNPAFPRIMSTLRDPNSLGAYLLFPIALLSARIMHMYAYTMRRKLLLVALVIVHIVALYLTFSRSAWLGVIIVWIAIAWWRFSSQFVRILKRWWPALIVGVIITGGALFVTRHDASVGGILTHSTSAQAGPYGSNEYHLLYIKHGVERIWHNPLGHGPGTAGLASIHNPGGGMLTENYYVQIGYELGVLGLVMLIGMQVWLYIHIARCRNEWTIVLLATFWAYVATNMLLHTWSNEAVAAQWWLVAGLVLGVTATGKAKKRSDAQSDATTPHADV